MQLNPGAAAGVVTQPGIFILLFLASPSSISFSSRLTSFLPRIISAYEARMGRKAALHSLVIGIVVLSCCI